MNTAGMITTTYQDIEIAYIEGSDEWEFTLRGRTRRASSLAKAKDAIDKVPADKKKAFERFECLFDHYGGMKKVTVTSFAGYGYAGTREWWIVDGDGTRRKEAERDLIVISDANTGRLAEILRLKAEIDERNDSVRALMTSLTRISPPPDVDTEKQ